MMSLIRGWPSKRLTLRGPRRIVLCVVWTSLLTALIAGSLLSCDNAPLTGTTARPTPTYALGTEAAPTTSHSPTASAPLAPAAASFSLQGFTNGPWLEQQGPVLASSIKMLSWILDGVDHLEAKALQDLLYIAAENRSVALSLVSLGWVQDGIDDLEVEAFHWINNLGSPQVASSLVSLGWMQDGVDEMEIKAMEEISYIDYRSGEVASSVVTLGWVQDGISDVEAEAIELVANIRSAEVASSVVSLGWVDDDISELEVKAVERISYIAVVSHSVAASVVSLGWVQDGIDDVEVEVLHWINNIGSAEVASSVVSLGWVQDGISEIEVKAVEEISYIDYRSPGLALSLVSLPWVQDGIHDVEAEAIDWVANIGSEEVASSVVSLDWVQDGVSEIEIKAIEQISYIDFRSVEVASYVMSLGWVEDGVSDQEAEVDLMEDTTSLAGRDAVAALRVVSMPFMETIEPHDEAAMTALRQLAADYPEVFASVLSHPALGGGISNDLAPVVATLNGVARTNPGLIDALLDPSRVHVEQRTVTLPLSGDVTLTIIRTRTGASRSM